MATRYSWKGYLKLSLVSVPVKAYSAVSTQAGEIHFHQLHAKCHSRIKYVKTCPVHGAVRPDEIVSGYEYAKDQYVVMEPGELDHLKGESDKSISMEAIVPTSAIDALYLTDRSSFLVPDGPVGQKPYALIQQCLASRDAVAVARLVRNGKDEVVVIRPLEDLLVLTVLSSVEQVKSTQTVAAEITKTAVSAAELKLTNTLFDAFQQDEINLADYKDHFTERVTQLIEAKIQGQETTATEASPEPGVINLMEALKKSVAFAQNSTARKTTLSASKSKEKSGRSVTSRRKPKSA